MYYKLKQYQYVLYTQSNTSMHYKLKQYQYVL